MKTGRKEKKMRKIKKSLMMFAAVIFWGIATVTFGGCSDSNSLENQETSSQNQDLKEEETGSQAQDSEEEKDSSQLQGTADDERIEIVKGGNPIWIPNITYEDAYAYFFGNPTWRYFDADDGSEVVEFVGDCTYNDDPAEVYIQFVLNSDDSFSLEYACAKVNGETIETEESDIFQLIYKPFSQYAEEVLEEPLDDEVEEKFYEWYLEILEKEEGYYDNE